MSKVRVGLWLAVALMMIFSARLSHAQDYLSATGTPTFGMNIPVENGFINISNGDLHMEFTLASHKQRGTLQLNERLVYDSRIWKIVHNGSYYWQPTNVFNSNAGWRFFSGIEQGLQTSDTVDKDIPCDSNSPGAYTYWGHTTMSWTDPAGTQHTFDAGWTTISSDCTYPNKQETTSGYATDGSGYSIQASGTNDSPPSTFTICDSQGNVVDSQGAARIVDRFGNYWSQDATGNLVDDLGRTPVVATTNGNVTYYDVLIAGGGRARYTATYAQIPIHTNFAQSAVNEWSGTLNALQSLQLPDGSAYRFTYDTAYGELISVTLPTGGTVSYQWNTFQDSFQNKNQWISSHQTGQNPATTFTQLSGTEMFVSLKKVPPCAASAYIPY